MGLSFNPVISKYTGHSLGLQWKCHIFCLKKCVHIYKTQSTTRQSEANWSRWPLLNHITGDHISLFIGHKWSTSVSTWLSFHTKHSNRDSSAISVAPLCLFKPACVSYIKPPRGFSLLCQKVYFWKYLIRENSVERAMIFFIMFTRQTLFALNDLFT